MGQNMRKTLLAWLAVSLALIAAPPSARAEKLDPALFQDLLKIARAYAADRTLIFYCLRKRDEMMPFLYAGVHLDIAYALQLLRASGADERQRAELIEAVLRNVHSAPRDEEDPQRNRDCAAAEVEKNLAVLKGVGAPLFQRPPFERLKP
jgi:hypothetical protein